jgi:hypothetical protein
MDRWRGCQWPTQRREMFEFGALQIVRDAVSMFGMIR